MKNFITKNKIAAVIVIFLLAVPVSAYFGSVLMLDRIQQQNDEYQKSLINNKLEKLKVKKIPKMEETNAEFEKSSYAIESILSNNKEVEFIRYLEKLADETKNKIIIKILDTSKEDLAKKAKVKTIAQQKAAKKIELDGEVDDAKAKAKQAEEDIEGQLAYDKYTPIQIELEGKYADLLNFISKLENSKHYANIISLSIEKDIVKEKIIRDEIPIQASKDIFLSIPAEKAPMTEEKEEVFLRSFIRVIVYME